MMIKDESEVVFFTDKKSRKKLGFKIQEELVETERKLKDMLRVKHARLGFNTITPE